MPFIARYRWPLFEVLVIAIVLRLLALAEPFAVQAIIDHILSFERQQTLWVIAVVLLLVALFDAALGAISVYLSLRGEPHLLGSGHGALWACPASAALLFAALACGGGARTGGGLAAHDPISVRRAVGYVPQEPRPFAGTVRENLTLMVPDATDETLRALEDGTQ
ncbi:MAG: hypothetical protein ACU0CI_12510 [Shimia sp.]